MEFEKFLQILIRSKLVEEPRLAQLVAQEFADSDPQKKTPKRLVSRLVKLTWITQWHAEKLLAGKYKGFFLGKYRLLDHLGAGGMSNVYLAEHLMIRRRVAIKVLPPGRVDEPGYLERFQLEAKAAAKLDHVNIVRAYDVDCDSGLHYLVMEYVPGENLHKLVKIKGPLPPEVAADYVRQAALGLQHAHQAGLVHRDVKPSNLLVTNEGVVKVLDLGLAYFPQDVSSQEQQKGKVVLGTADYLAPEQAKDCYDVDHRADIYSLGCTLFYLLCGQAPFTGGTFAQRILKHQMDDPPDIGTSRPDCPPFLVDFCLQMMRKKPEDRIESMQSVVDQLTKWLKPEQDESSNMPAVDEVMPVPAPSELKLDLGTSPATRNKHRPSRSTAKKPWLIWVLVGFLSLICSALLVVVFLANR